MIAKATVRRAHVHSSAGAGVCGVCRAIRDAYQAVSLLERVAAARLGGGTPAACGR